MKIKNQNKLQLFAELACHKCSEGEYVVPDASDPENKKRADEWLNKELTFLRKHDVDELKRIWKLAIDDGRNTRLLFSAVKVLQDKYQESI